MRIALIDTNIASALFRSQGPLYTVSLAALGDRIAVLSFMSRAELILWPKSNSWGPSREAALRKDISNYTTIYPDDEMCEIWTIVKQESRRKGRPITTADAWIAATAIRYQLPLITLNHRDFNFIDDLELIPVNDPSPNH